MTKKTSEGKRKRQKRVGTNADRKLADEAQCWRYKGVPMFSVNNINRSISEEFKRLGKVQMIFVEGGAVDIARTTKRLLSHGFTENEQKSNYIVDRKCPYNEAFSIGTGDGKIVFDGAVLTNEQEKRLCHRCFELGMIVVDCCAGHKVERVPSVTDLVTLELGVGTMDMARIRKEQYNTEKHYNAEQINFLLTAKQVQQSLFL